MHSLFLNILPNTIPEHILHEMSSMEMPARAGDIIAVVVEKTSAHPRHVRNELGRLKRAGRLIQPRNGYYELPKEEDGWGDYEYVEKSGKRTVVKDQSEGEKLERVMQRPAMVWRGPDGTPMIVIGIYVDMKPAVDMGSLGIEDLGAG